MIRQIDPCKAKTTETKASLINEMNDHGGMKKSQYSKITTCALAGIEGVLIEIELCLLPGLPGFEVGGNCDNAVRESRDRVRAAINNSFYAFPKGRVLASYSPATFPKSGSAFDLALALAVLEVSKQISRPQGATPIAAFGELSLDGRIHTVPGILNRLLALEKSGIKDAIGPSCDFNYHQFLSNCRYHVVSDLSEAIEIYSGVAPAFNLIAKRQIELNTKGKKETSGVSFSMLNRLAGQEAGIRAITIAAAGWHPLLLMGAPGCGKTSLAAALAEILPPLAEEEILQVLLVEQVADITAKRRNLSERPFRRPHHSITASALLGGGVPPKLGECTLAHCGVLFLDELTEVRPQALDVLREPMELKKIHLARSTWRVSYPADFLLISACNPCRCGERLEADGDCRCSEYSVERHLDRISGPLYDRFDLIAQLNRVKAPILKASLHQSDDSRSEIIQSAVRAAWERQKKRCTDFGKEFFFNSLIPIDQLVSFMQMNDSCLIFISELAEEMRFSFRAFHSVLRVARTIADLRASESVEEEDLALALDYRLPLPSILSERSNTG